VCVCVCDDRALLSDVNVSEAACSVDQVSACKAAGNSRDVITLVTFSNRS